MAGMWLCWVPCSVAGYDGYKVTDGSVVLGEHLATFTHMALSGFLSSHLGLASILNSGTG